MARDYLNSPLTKIRRKDRSKPEDVWIKEYLETAAFGTISLSWEGQPFANSNIFVYDSENHVVFFHTAHEGRTREILESNPKVCFTTNEMGRLLPAPVALEFSVEYSGVSIFGTTAVVDDEVEATEGLQLLLDKYFPHLKPIRDYRPITLEELKRTTVFRINIESWIGKEKKVEPEFEGAFLYGEISNLLEQVNSNGTS